MSPPPARLLSRRGTRAGRRSSVGAAQPSWLPVTAWAAVMLLAVAGCEMPFEASGAQPGGLEGSGSPDGGEDTPPGQPDAPPPVAPPSGLAVAAASAAESDGVLRFTVNLNRARSVAVTVAWATEDGTAKAGTDYHAATGRLTFPPESSAAQQIEVRLIDDQVAEARETLTVRLSEPRGAPLVVATATGTIQDDDDPTLGVGPSELFVTEGGSATYAVTLGSRPTASVTVTVTAPDAAELTVAPEQLVFTPEQWRDAREVTVTAAHDDDPLADAPVQLAHAASGGGYDGIAAPTVTVTIVEDDSPVLAITPATAREPDGSMVFSVTLSLAGDLAVTVDYATGADDDTAVEGEGLRLGERRAAVSGAIDGGADRLRDRERRPHGRGHRRAHAHAEQRRQRTACRWRGDPGGAGADRG